MIKKYLIIQFLFLLALNSQEYCNSLQGYIWDAKVQCLNCLNSCKDCYFDKEQICMGCKWPYMFNKLTKQCQLTCPLTTYMNQNYQCIKCKSQNCLECDEQKCIKCKEGFNVNPLNQQQCIQSTCDDEMYYDKQKGCSFSCIIEPNTEDSQMDFQEKTCFQLQQCPQFYKTTNLLSGNIQSKQEYYTHIIIEQQGVDYIQEFKGDGNLNIYNIEDRIQLNQLTFMKNEGYEGVFQFTISNSDNLLFLFGIEQGIWKLKVFKLSTLEMLSEKTMMNINIKIENYDWNYIHFEFYKETKALKLSDGGLLYLFTLDNDESFTNNNFSYKCTFQTDYLGYSLISEKRQLVYIVRQKKGSKQDNTIQVYSFLQTKVITIIPRLPIPRLSYNEYEDPKKKKKNFFNL